MRCVDVHSILLRRDAHQHGDRSLVPKPVGRTERHAAHRVGESDARSLAPKPVGRTNRHAAHGMGESDASDHFCEAHERLGPDSEAMLKQVSDGKRARALPFSTTVPRQNLFLGRGWCFRTWFFGGSLGVYVAFA